MAANENSSIGSIQGAAGENQADSLMTVIEDQIVLTTPAPGEDVVIAVGPDEQIVVDFDLGDVVMRADQTDLILDFGKGTTITLQDFRTFAGGEEPPTIILADGTMVAGDDLIFSLGSEQVEPAAGPEAMGSGIGEYRDDLGDILAGLGRLGPQDPDSIPTGAGQVPDDENASPLLAVAEEPVDEEPEVPVNDAPDAVNDAYATPEDTALNIPIPGLLGNDSDGDGNPLSVIGNTDPAHGTVVLNSDGSFTYTPDANFNGDDSFSYTIGDGEGGTDTATVSISVRPVNDAPAAVNDAYETPEDTALNIPIPGLLGNDSDVDGDPLSVISNTDAAHGTVVLNADGSFTYTPNANFNGDDSFTYTVSDGAGGTDTATVSITVSPVNDDPDAVRDYYETPEDTTLNILIPGVLINDSDVDGDSLSVVSNTEAANGTVVLNADGSFTYTPNADFTGTDEFTYTVSDGAGGEDTTTVRICVKPVDDSPVAENDYGVINTAFLVAANNVNNPDFFRAFLDPEATNAYVKQGNLSFKVDELSYDSGGVLWAVANGSPRNVYTVDPLTGNATLQFTLDASIGNDVDGFAFGSYGGDELMYVLSGNDLFVVDPSDGSVITSHVDLLNTSSDLADLAMLNGKLYTISSNGTLFEINLDPETGAVTSADNLGTLNVTSLYGMVAGDDGLLYVVNSTGNKGEVHALSIDSEGNTFSVVDSFEIANPKGGGNLDGLAGEVNPGSELSGNVLDNDFDTDTDHDQLSVIAVNGTSLDESLSLEGFYGTLDIASDGSYTYTLTDDTAPGFEVFNYTVSDGSSTDTADLIIRVNNNFTGELLIGTEAGDVLSGHGGADLLIGGEGDDLLTGGAGNDLMRGDSGSDIFVFSAKGGEGNDVVLDFNVDQDTLRFNDVLDVNGDSVLNANDVNVDISINGADVALTIIGSEGSTTITLNGINAGGDFSSENPTLDHLISHGLNVEMSEDPS